MLHSLRAMTKPKRSGPADLNRLKALGLEYKGHLLTPTMFLRILVMKSLCQAIQSPEDQPLQMEIWKATMNVGNGSEERGRGVWGQEDGMIL